MISFVLIPCHRSLIPIQNTDVRTHPPIQFTFPPLTAKQKAKHRENHEMVTDSETESDIDHHLAHSGLSRARSTTTRHLRASSMRRSQTLPESQLYSSDPEDDVEITEENRWLSMQGLIGRTSAYVTLDGTRMSALSPSHQASFTATFPSPSERTKSPLSPISLAPQAAVGDLVQDSLEPIPPVKSRLPNTNLLLDLRTLNLHLKLRTAEILACTEAMWEWVLEYQTKAHAQRRKQAEVHRQSTKVKAVSRSNSIDIPSKNKVRESHTPRSAGPVDAVLELTREDFDGLLSRFELWVLFDFLSCYLYSLVLYRDMQDHMSLGEAMEERFQWSVIHSAPPTDRESFDKACKRWEKWQAEQKHPSLSPYSETASRHQSTTSTAGLSLPPDAIHMSDHDDSNEGLVQPDVSRLSLPGNIRERTQSTATLPASAPASARLRSRSRVSSVASSSIMIPPPTRRLSRAMRVFVAWKE